MPKACLSVLVRKSACTAQLDTVLVQQQEDLAIVTHLIPSGLPFDPLQGFFLALQAAWLVNDQRIYPAMGKLYRIDLENGSNYKPNIHMVCKGPTDTGLSTFILEAGGGAPGVTYAGIVDELAAAGRRACWYDR